LSAWPTWTPSALPKGSNPVVNQLCAELELIAARKMGRVVNGLYNDWSW
jgi:hypothetical protein